MTNFEGKFCWVDLTTTNLEASKKFYGELFGWRFEEEKTPEGGTYSTAHVGDKGIAGIVEQPKASQGGKSTWNSYFSVKNLEAFAEKATRYGATTIVPRKNIGTYGALSVLQDPAGAYFCTWESAGDPNVEGEYMSEKPGYMAWVELATRDLDRAGKFYSEVFDFSPESMNMGGDSQPYFLFKHDQKPQAGLMGMPKEMPDNLPSHWMNHVSVENCDRSLEKATQMGAKTLYGPQDIPNMGRFATIQDPQGAVISIFAKQ